MSLDIFNKYAGAEVAVIKSEKPYDDFKVPAYAVNEADAIVVAIRQDAAQNGLSVSFNLPRSASLVAADSKRLNVTLQKGENDKWFVQPNFTVG